MRNLKVYEKFDDYLIRNILKVSGIKNYSINLDNSVDVYQDCQLWEGHLNYYYGYHRRHREIPIKFGTIDGDFICDGLKIETLKNCPKYVSKNFSCGGNKLTTLLDGPQHVGGFYNCANNDLKDFYGLPDDFRGIIYASGNPTYELFDLMPGRSIIKFEIMEEIRKFINLLNEFRVIRSGDTIIKDRLQVALEYIGGELPDDIEFKNYKLV